VRHLINVPAKPLETANVDRHNPPCGLKTSAGISPMGILTTLQELQAIYGSPAEASIVKEVDAIIPQRDLLGRWRALTKGGRSAVDRLR
jgi:hypothetical protein